MAKSPKRGRPAKYGPTGKTGRSGKRVSLDIDPAIRAALDDFADSYFAETHFRIGLTQIVEKSLIEMLERAGHWPPKPR